MSLIGLTDKQEKFVQELLKGKSQREAYRLAYSKNKSCDKTIDEMASKLFNTDKVHARYNELHNRLIKESEDECIISAKKVLEELATIAFSDITKIVNTDGKKVNIKSTSLLSEQERKVISSIKQTKEGVEIKFYDKERALEMLSRHLGMFNDKVELSGDIRMKNPFAELTTEELKKLINDG